MLNVVDGPGGVNDWAHIDWEKKTIWFEESDTIVPLSTAHFTFAVGKYQGYKLSEVSDSWYLTFIRDKNPNDVLVQYAFSQRLGELKI